MTSLSDYPYLIFYLFTLQQVHKLSGRTLLIKVREIQGWLKECVLDEDYRFSNMEIEESGNVYKKFIYFKNKEDLVAFKLKFGI
jgi:hypothetical protein